MFLSEFESISLIMTVVTLFFLVNIFSFLWLGCLSRILKV